MSISNSMLKEAKNKTKQIILLNDLECSTDESKKMLLDLINFLKKHFKKGLNYKKILILALRDSGMDLSKSPEPVQKFLNNIPDINEKEAEVFRKISNNFF